MKKISIILFSIILLFTFCNDRELAAPVSQTYDIELGQLVKRDVVGQVLDENGQPMVGADVSIDKETKKTDNNGRFEFFNTDVYQNHVFVKVHSHGYLMGSRSIVPTDGVNNVSIKMLPAKKFGTVNSSTGGEVRYEQVQIDFKSGFVLENGQVYTGKVIVNGNYINPLAKDIGDIMPGSLRAADENGETYLKTFGMVGVELNTENGEKLQLAEGSSAILSLRVPEGMRADAPATIPLWHFDEEQGIWSQEGSADLIDGKYVGEVSHFSFWNCDIRVPSVTAWGRLVNKNGTALCGVKIRMVSKNAGIRMGFSDSKGVFGGLMPSGIELKLEVMNNNYEIIYKHVLPPLTGTDIGDITVDMNSTASVTGKIINCDGTPFNGLIQLNGNYIDVKNGALKYEAALFSSLNIAILSNDKSHRRYLAPIEVQTDDIDLGEISACDKSTQAKWIESFLEVNQSYYAFAKITDSTQIQRISIQNYAVYEDLENGVFMFKSGKSNGGVGEDYFTISIPFDHTTKGIHSVLDNSKNKVKFYAGGDVQEITDLNLSVNLNGLNFEYGLLSDIEVSGTFSVKNSQGVYETKAMYMAFSFRL
ncbi:MAG: hypothetical protein COA58_14295 [Bacteroidetes bacterium]|nr:MAG: hypothetical protein COA58_14295 [Bacteroidota bacterium]